LDNLINALYQNELVDEDFILLLYNNPSKSILYGISNSDAELTRAQVKDLINWLMVPGEDDDEEEID
jgi:hypothetical protein